MTWSFAEVERLELLGNLVQPPESPAVVIFIMTLDEPQRQTIHQPGASVDRCQLVSHLYSFSSHVAVVNNSVIERHLRAAAGGARLLVHGDRGGDVLQRRA